MTTWGCPDSINVLPVTADRDTWLKARREGVGGSDASAIAGVNPYTSVFDVWLDKVGRAPAQEYTPWMRWGHLIEDDARQVFTEDTGIRTRLVGLQRSRERPWQQVTPDGLTDDGGLVEIKSVGWREAHKWDDGQVADHAEVQSQHAMAVTGRGHVWVIAEIDRTFHWHRVERDDRLIATLTQMEDEFWHGHVLTGQEPPLTAGDLDTVKQLFPAARPETTSVVDAAWLTGVLTEYARACGDAKAAEDAKARVEAEIVNAIGDHEALAAVDGDGAALIRATRKNYTRAGLDRAALKADHPYIYAKYETASPYRRLTILKKPRRP